MTWPNITSYLGVGLLCLPWHLLIFIYIFSLLCSIPQQCCDYTTIDSFYCWWTLELFQFMNSAKYFLCWMHVNISVGYILGNETAGSQDMPRFSLIDTADYQFSKVIIKSTYTLTGKYKNSSCSTSLPKYCIIRLISYSHSGGYPMVSHCNQTEFSWWLIKVMHLFGY